MNGRRQIVRNTGFLYLRMVVMMFITFFTSRILLKSLGIDDFGLFSVIVGVVGMLASLRGSFSSSIQRFLNYEMGLSRALNLQKIYSMGINIHLLISVVFLLITESAGLWFLNYKLVIPPDRLFAANWIFQFAIASSIVTIMTIPQDAVIIANQKMEIYAYITLLEAVLKFGTVFLLPYFQMDSLILYAFFILAVSFIIRWITYLYCVRTFAECKYLFIWDKLLFKKLGSFAGWNFLGNSSYSMTTEGLNIILNLFGGPVANAARGIAHQIRIALGLFNMNIQIASAPHLTELYAQKQLKRFEQLFCTISKFSFLMMGLICLPVILYAKILLGLWLYEVPPYTVAFTQLTLVFILIRTFHYPVDVILKAVGDIKWYQITESITLLLPLPFAYGLLYYGFALYTAYIAVIAFELLNLIIILQIARRVAGIHLSDYFKFVMAPSLIVLIINAAIALTIKKYFNAGSVIMFFLAISTMTLAGCAVSWILGFNGGERRHVKKIIRKTLCRLGFMRYCQC